MKWEWTTEEKKMMKMKMKKMKMKMMKMMLKKKKMMMLLKMMKMKVEEIQEVVDQNSTFLMAIYALVCNREGCYHAHVYIEAAIREHW